MRTRISNLPQGYSVVIDINKKNNVTIKVQQGEETLFTKSRAFICCVSTKSKFRKDVLTVEVENGYDILISLDIDFSTGVITYFDENYKYVSAS